MTGNDPPQYIVEHDGDYLFVVHVEGIVFFTFQTWTWTWPIWAWPVWAWLCLGVTCLGWAWSS